MASWVDHAIWWHVYPLGFVGAEPEAVAADAVHHRLHRLEPWLDYLIELGCNGLLLGPIFASETHGYDTVDHLRVDSRVGTADDVAELIEACRGRGVRVLFDGVFNHVGRGFGPFQDVLTHGRNSTYVDWFRIDWDSPGPDGFSYASFEGHGQLVALNHANPAVVDYVAGVMSHWLDAGIAGWRLDAAYAAPPEFWRAVTARVRATHPSAWLMGEVIHGDYPAWVRDGGLDSITQYELWKAIWSSLNDRNLFELAWAFDRHEKYAAEFLPLTFVGNHDVTRLASQLTDPRHFGHALAVLFTVSGIPSVYAGDEQGFQGVKEERVGGDDAVRPAFPASPAELAPDGWPLYRLHQDLIGLRRRHPWLVRGQLRVLGLANRQLAYEVASPDSAAIVVLLNLDDAPHRFESIGTHAEVLLASEQNPADATLVEPHGWTILSR